ncbi:hypothetical protein C9J03_09410 [Photobacterium gaetbulicola]|uniref:hypothetical protein n=1 Tax=Photobacterium TaxID=657 RepID=UPI0005CC4FC9|nr:MULTISPECIES: hypothetical protein [Photobacterium]PSU12775.1 hypothetical protein C9J03_09410 [Photobacterium gaetbulicola]WEM44356.1 hypothetical protein PTW35_24065 [Photobacterium sp. DA100]
MTQERAINLYYYLLQENTPQKELNAIMRLLKEDYGIDLSRIDRKRRRPQNRFDINNYGAGGSRTMNQTRQIQSV